jgi:hypothetical protein
MNWIERGDFEEIENLHNMDRPRGLAAAIVLGEVVLAVVISTAVATPFIMAGGGGHPGRLVALASLQMWPHGATTEPAPEADRMSPDAGVEPPAPGNLSTLTTGPGDGDSFTGEAAQDDIRIVSISPSPTIPLWVGDIVNFQFTVEYNLATASSAPLRVTIEECTCEEPNPLPVSTSTASSTHFVTHLDSVADRGRRTATLSRRIRVPVVWALNVSAHFIRQPGSTGPVDARHYRVTDPGRPPVGPQSSARIVSALPDPAKPLRAGDEVLFDVVTEYNLTTEVGTLHLTVGPTGGEPAAHFTENVRKGQRRLVFRERVRIPDVAGPLNLMLQLGGVEPAQALKYSVESR